jgi:HlyD family secretion protein
MDDLHLQDAQPAQPGQAGWGKLLLGTGLGVLLTLVATQAFRQFADKAPAPASISNSNTPHVTVVTVISTNIQQTLAATGTVMAAEMVPVLSPINGLKIQQVLAEEGDLVTQGQVLAILDTAVLQSQLRQIEAEMRVSEARLAELRAGSRIEEIDRARAEVQSAEAEVARAKSDLALADQRVQRNQALASAGAIASDRLDEILNQARSSQSNLAQAEAELQQAIQQLAELRAGARPEAIAQAQAQLDANRERIQTLTVQLEDAQVLASRSGKIAERQARVGDVTSASSKMFSIIDDQRLELWLEVPETQLPRIRRQQGVWIGSDAPQLRLAGRVQDIDPLIDAESRMALVKVSLPESGLLQPGMFLRGAILTAARQGLSLPSEAVLPQPDGRMIVYRLKAAGQAAGGASKQGRSATVAAQFVEIGEVLPNAQIEIKQGLNAGDQVVVKGAAYLGEGDRVEVVQ